MQSRFELAAPGEKIRSTYPTYFGNYSKLSGTSMAAPHVSGTAAQLMATGLSNDEASQQLTEPAGKRVEI